MIVQGDDCYPRSPSIVVSPLPPKSHSPPLPLVPEMRREEGQENEKENKERENKEGENKDGEKKEGKNKEGENKEKENKEKENKEMGNKEKEKDNNVVSSCDNSEEERQRREECQTVETSSPAPCEVTNQVHP